VTTRFDYALGVIAGVFLVHALVWAARQLWLSLRAPGEIRASEKRLAAHVREHYSKRGSLSR